MAKQTDYEDYVEFLKKTNTSLLNNDIDFTHTGYPLSVKESKFISAYIMSGNLNKSLSEAGLKWGSVKGKDYITEEIAYRLAELKKKAIADADEILQYLTSVMRGHIKDQFGLDAPLAERTGAAKELAKRIIDIPRAEEAPEIKVTLNWDN